MEFKRHYHGWDRPFTLAFADYLKAAAGASRELDDWLVWVPSARAGRHILSQLFVAGDQQAEAFHPPELQTPAQFVRSLKGGLENSASELRCLHTWKRVLEEAGEADLAPVFPLLPTGQRRQWAFAAARQLMQVRSRLAEDNWDFARAAARKPPRDADRWRVLANLETAYRERLESAGLRDPDSALEKELDDLLANLPGKRLAIAAVLNLSKREARCVEGLKRCGLAVEFHLPIPAERADGVDEWGRPRPGVWEREALPEDLLEATLHRAPEPRALAESLLDLAGSSPDTDALAVGCCEADLSRYLIERSRFEGSPFYAPEGKPLSRTAWGRLISLLHDWRESGNLSSLAGLLDHAAFREWTRSAGESPGQLQAAIIEARSDHLMSRAGQLADPELGPSRAIGRLRAFIDKLEDNGFGKAREGRFAEGLWDNLQTVASGCRMVPEERAILGRLEEILEDLNADFDPAATDNADFPDLLDFELSRRFHYPERAADERPVSGWLELPWETAPHLVLFGLPDSQVPGSGRIDAFLTPGLCRFLGLYGPEEEAAFHAFRLRLILESRRGFGKLDILLPDRGLDDSPVLPSRFLFLAGENALLARVDRLLGERPGAAEPVAASFGTSLKPPDPPPLKAMAVTAFRAYLANPFHFLLHYQFGWEAPEPLPRELDPMAFGTLAHAVLERLNGDPEGASLTGEGEIRAYLDAALEAETRRRFGSEWTVPLRIQVSALRQRLNAAVPVIARERAAGWRPEKAEWRFHKEIEFAIAGVQLRGMVDLLERNLGTGAYRIVDYKTADKGTGIRRSHFFHPNARSAGPFIPECEFADGKKTARWTDLQLPLYQKAVEMATGERAECAYFNLAKAVSDIGLDTWTPGPGHAAAAMACAEAIIGRIQSGQFPVAEATTWDDPWLAWFGSDYASTLDKTWLGRYGGGGS